MAAIGQASQSVAVCFSPNTVKSFRLIIKHGFEPCNRRIHSPSQLFQLRHGGLLHGDKAPFHDRLRLVDYRIQWPPQSAKDERRHIATS